ncbi:unnamed protein product [Ranitomeya imitator]|uniref:Platelet glycoprotein 4 n=1 Tax=Ranitomeya imitator TaxID=111125 RepID=A0ABN9MH00_9NEOB|nr:unnamed protein product [Ranitomeya imitator]
MFCNVNRSIYGEFEKEYTLKGIKLYRFVVPATALASPYDNPDNHCYCTDKVISRNCNASGVLDLRAKKPVFLSLPHFLFASDFILESLDGINRNVEEHKTFVDVEPITGFTMHFAKRLQVNIFFNRTSQIDILANLQSEFVFPVVWLNETAMIGDDTANTFKSKVATPMNALKIHGNQGKDRVTKRSPALSYPMFTLVTGIVGRWRAVCVTALQRPNSDAAAIRVVVGIAAASLNVKGP